MRATRISFENVGTALASKDASVATLEESVIRGANYAALVAYIKKPEFGPAVIEARELDVDPASRLTLAQTGSRITLDGVDVPTEDVDVAELYDTIMRPGLRR